MRIITPPDAETVSAVESGHYVTLGHQGSKLTIPTLPRPGNHSEVIYLADAGLQFVPGAGPVIAGVFACHAGEPSLTLYPLPSADSAEQGA